MRKPDQKTEYSSTQIMYKARAMKALRQPLFLTRLGLLLERATRAFWPLWSWSFVLFTVFSFGLVDHLSIELAYILTLLGLAGVIGGLVYGFRRFRFPGMDATADRLDRSLSGRPLTALWDGQAIGTGDAASTAVWRAHVQRMAEQAAMAKPVQPDLQLSKRDPFALRYVAATAFVVALLFGSINRGSDLGNLLDRGDGAALSSGPIYEGWIEPPRYTGLPSIYLNQVVGTDPLPVPVGSKVTLRLYGQANGLALVETVSGNQPSSDETAVTELDFTVAQSGVLQIAGAVEDTSWQIEMIPDTSPMIAITGPIERTPRGETKFSFEAADDYGVVAGIATIELDLVAVDRRYGLALEPEPQQNITLDIPLPFRGDTREFTDFLIEDLSKHPWAGLPVILSLHAFDDIEQPGAAEPELVALPGLRFFDPLAGAVAEQRRDLLWNRHNAKRASQVLRALSNLPEEIFDNSKAYLILRTAIRRLEYNMEPELRSEMRDEIAELLWQTALLLEKGDLSDAEQRLARAQERLSEALENGATEEEIAELTEELRRAMQEYMEQLAREAEENPDSDQANNGERREITSDQLQEMLDRIEQLSREGRMQEAQELLEQLRQMMENMRTARRQQGEGEGSQSQQAMRGLQDTMRQQQGLSDDAFRQMQEQFNGQQPNGQLPDSTSPGRGVGKDGEPLPDGLPSAQDLAKRQEALRDLLESQRRALPDGNSQEGQAARDALRQAEREMGQARDALEQGDIPQALDEQAQALDALREGIDNLGREIARNQNQNMGRQGEQAGSPDPNSERDPLGRQTGTMGRIGSEETLLPDQDLYLRSRELMDEIRRRSGDKSRPRIELDYLERLLDRF